MAVYYGELHKLQDKLASYCKLLACTCSSAEAEYLAVAITTCELKWMKLLSFVGV